MELELYDAKGKSAGTLDLPEGIFGLKARKGFLFEAVAAHLANLRAGSAHTKTKAEVSGGGKKPWKQKHTGRARAGSTRSPLWRKGGVVFGPRNEVNWKQAFPRKKALLALGQALSAKRESGALQLVQAFDVQEPKTKRAAELLKALKAPEGTLVVTDRISENLRRASRNIQGLALERAADLHAYEVLSSRRVILTKPAVEVLQGRFSKSVGRGDE